MGGVQRDRRAWGSNLAGVVALIAAAMALVMIARNRQSGLKVIDVAGMVTFLVLAAVAFAGKPVDGRRRANYGRGLSALALGGVMLGPVAFMPFTE